MFFSNYKYHKNSTIRKSLLWEYDLDRFDWHAMRNVVVQRIVERGRPDDYYAALNLYGLDGFRQALMEIPDLHPKDAAFVCSVFGINKNNLKCYSRKQSIHQHWNS
jgi:hypothetical protein